MVPQIVRCVSAAVAFSLFPFCAIAQQPAPALRVWTAVNGQKFQAKFLGVEGVNAVFQLANGQTTKVALQHLSPADQAAIRGGAAARPAAPIAPGAAATTAAPKGGAPANPTNPTNAKPGVPSAAKPRTWPAIVEVPPNSIEITLGEQDAAKRRYVYKSQSFEFVSQDKLAGSVMKEVARTFEATRSLVSALPWGINPTPPPDLGFYQAKLFVTREDYFADGGPVNSGGVYFSKDRIFRIPFASLGLEMRGKTWFKKADYRGDTIVHEVTHQMMHDFLPFLPKWVIEGTAEYTESLPYNAGRFLAGSHARGLKEYIAKAASHHTLTSEFRPFGDHIAMKRDNWESLSGQQHSQHLLYFQSYVLVYYFCHLDGDGKGTRFLKYLDAIAEARDEWSRFFKNPLVKMNPDGSYTFPSTLPQPAAKQSEEFGIEKLSILFDGRDAAALDADIRSAFKKIGIKL
ncbi:MAG: hypothetical protein ABI318_18955 [Chthoniobacteraceae bacterium]